MPEELEIEFKNLLSEMEFNNIKDKFSIQKEDFTIQKNHYFETYSNDLMAKKSALRIREKKGTFELTLKQPAKEGLLETNQQITEEESSKMLKEGILPSGEVKAALHTLGIVPDTFTYFGTLATNRAETEYKDGLLVLDYSFYLNNEDYELEYEVKEKKSGEADFFRLLREMDIPLRPAENKIKRFLRAADKI